MKQKNEHAPVLWRIIFYLKQEKLLFFAGIAAMVLASASQLLPPLIVAHIIDKSIPNKDMPDMMMYGGAFVFVILLSGLLSFLQINLLAKLGIKIITVFKRNVFQHLLYAPISYFNAHPVGELIAKVESDSENVKNLFSNTSITIIGNMMFFVGVYLVLLYKDSMITLILTFPIILIAISFYFLTKLMSKLYRQIREQFTEATAVITEYVQGMLLIQVLNKQERVYNQLFGISNSKRKTDTKFIFSISGTFNFFQFVLSVLLVIVVIHYSTAKIILGSMTIGTLFVFIQYMNKLFIPLESISNSFIEIQGSIVSLKRIIELTNLKTEKDFHAGTIPAQFNREIRFENVWFAYQNEEWVLKDVSFTIPKGNILGLVGQSGSGKSTCINLLCCFYSPQKGNIYVDDIPVQELELYEWRKQIGLILQDIFLFPGNITENVRVYNEDIGINQVKTALDIVQLNSFIQNQAQGLNTELAEFGQNISQGEKQLISFARALTFSPEIIIMDEATASIDMATEAKIQSTIKTMMSNKTAVIVAHRLSSILEANEILFFKDGEILHRGSHTQLLEICPEYKHMFELQVAETSSKGGVK